MNRSGSAQERSTPQVPIAPKAVSRTAGPWHRSDNAVIAYEGEKKRFIATAHHELNRDVAEAFANAAFIVTACNAHDDLVAALRELFESEKDLTDYENGEDGDWNEDDPTKLIGRLERARELALAALAKLDPVEGE